MAADFSCYMAGPRIWWDEMWNGCKVRLNHATIAFHRFCGNSALF
jgi:hypothetical protein